MPADPTVRGRFACGCEVVATPFSEVRANPCYGDGCVVYQRNIWYSVALSVARIGFAIAASEGRGPWAGER